MKEILNFNYNLFLFVKINYIISKKTSSLSPQRSFNSYFFQQLNDPAKRFKNIDVNLHLKH